MIKNGFWFLYKKLGFSWANFKKNAVVKIIIDEKEFDITEMLFGHKKLAEKSCI